MREYGFIHVFSRMSMYFPCFFSLNVAIAACCVVFFHLTSPHRFTFGKAEKFENAVRALQEASEEQENMEMFVHSGII